MIQHMRALSFLVILTVLLMAPGVSATRNTDTGQTWCTSEDPLTEDLWYQISCPSPGDFFGQDGDYTINPDRFVDNGDGTVTDQNTGLMWEQKTDDDSIRNRDRMFNWRQAKKRVFIEELNSTKFLGHEDWRLPTLKELLTIVSNGHYNPAVDTAYFPMTKTDYYYWTSDSYEPNSDYAWSVHFASGSNSAVHKRNSSSFGRYARAVREDAWDAHSYTDNFDGTVTEGVTGLTWQQQLKRDEEDPDTLAKMNWKEALNYCENLDVEGFRLPNRIELQSLVDYTQYDPSINTVLFPDTPALPFWTSTSQVYHAYAAPEAQAATIEFLSGRVAYKHKREPHHVRCVYGGDVQVVNADPCDEDPDCDDGEFCNGIETCVEGACQAAIDPCPGQTCDEDGDTCVECLVDGDCDDRLYCNGAETCVGGTCQEGSTVDCNDGISCTADSCNETTDSCDYVPNDSFCDDGLFCTGTEKCDPAKDCQPGTGDPCPEGQTCDEESDTCCTPSEQTCDDGLDNDCDGDADCDDLEDCAGDPACCGSRGDDCTSNDQCCSNKCRKRRGKCR